MGGHLRPILAGPPEVDSSKNEPADGIAAYLHLVG